LLELAARVRKASGERGEEEARLREEYEKAEAAWRASIEKPGRK
jgi:hypothetical protein